MTGWEPGMPRATHKEALLWHLAWLDATLVSAIVISVPFSPLCASDRGTVELARVTPWPTPRPKLMIPSHLSLPKFLPLIRRTALAKHSNSKSSLLYMPKQSCDSYSRLSHHKAINPAFGIS